MRRFVPVCWLLLATLPVSAGEPKDAIAAAEAIQHRMIDIANAGDALIAVGQHGVIVRKQAGGDWQQISSPVDVMFTRVHMLDDERGWILGYQESILETSDGGKSWELRRFDADGRSLNSLLFLNADHGIAVGAYGSVFETRDSGATWQATENMLSDLGMHLNAITRMPDGALVVVGERGLLARSNDDGATWSLIDFPYAGSLYGLFAHGEKGLVTYGMRGNLFVTTDLDSARPIDEELWDPYERVSLEDPEKLAEAGWRKVTSPVSESLFSHLSQQDGDNILVGLNATVLKLNNDATSLIAVPVEESETLTAIVPTGETIMAVGRRGIVDLGAIE